ncbi:phage tail assembly protein T [Edwardsiella tarda]|uniref:Phage tail assembly protein T n=1 Tax=Edwardsiella tarda ATCC 15947 = NBRC 105688 TaxID=667121 RepID=A0AC61TM22_EDWTA|nr:phage tail assembly protein T [Edwardsiella tarda]UAL55287.1 phage tail assembly protein T [Edwardsiella tarda]UCQ01671.1 phage tail assembly protein T [Edwardsiella tarda ATCC 15947 = NBRC 105688]UCQ29210.1 phage tail assembly protein T [Edwardsiella tarda]STD29381.1 phage tail assembly protein T [Edwardsiella tarda]
MAFILRLAREFHRPDWCAMLAGMSCSELRDWASFYREHLFADTQLDLEFAALQCTLVRLVDAKARPALTDFTLLMHATAPPEKDDAQLMQLASGLMGRERYVPDQPT